ncbi:MAG TPA: hypothetical protein VIZ65_00370 [Cellvibrionaceae bacterium]
MAAKQTRKRLRKPHSKKARDHRAMHLELTKVKKSLVGLTLAYNSSQGEDALMHPSNFEKARRLLGGDTAAGYTVADILETWPLNWQATAVIYCQDENTLFDQPANLTAENTTGKEIGELLEELIEELKKLCNPKFIKEWGFTATVIPSK